MKYLPYIVIAAVALILFLLLRKPKPVQQLQEEPLDPTGEGFRMGGGGGAGSFLPDGSSVTSWIDAPPILLVQPKMTYQQVVQRRLGEPVKKIGNLTFKPLPGSNIVKTPSGNTATVGVNPNKPTFT